MDSYGGHPYGTSMRPRANVGLLASRAAVELESLRLGRKTRLDFVLKLAQLLDESVIEIKDPSSPRSLLDPAKAVLFRRAINSSPYGGESHKVNSVDELVVSAKAIKTDLAKVVSDHASIDPGEVSRIRDFCVSLASSASAPVTITDDGRAAHPFRRITGPSRAR